MADRLFKSDWDMKRGKSVKMHGGRLLLLLKKAKERDDGPFLLVEPVFSEILYVSKNFPDFAQQGRP